LPLGSVRQAKAGPPPPAGAQVMSRKSICTHCAVGCTVTAEVANGVWIGQEPSWDSPINRGSHCAKGASVRELVSGERRLKYPLKLVDGEWTRNNWDQAINEIGDKLLAIREKSGRTRCIGSDWPNSPMKAPISFASSAPSGEPTIPITRRASAIQRRSPA
jgi:formate dehydrogenase major subunit